MVNIADRYLRLNHSSSPGTRQETRSSLYPSVRRTFSNMEADLYDEFGNYIGPELESDEESEEEEDGDEEEAVEYVSGPILISFQRVRNSTWRTLVYRFSLNVFETSVK